MHEHPYLSHYHEVTVSIILLTFSYSSGGCLCGRATAKHWHRLHHQIHIVPTIHRLCNIMWREIEEIHDCFGGIFRDCARERRSTLAF